MPDLSTITSGLNTAAYKNPVTSERGGYYDGTKGSWIARHNPLWEGGYYDKNLQDYSNQKDVRYQNQGWIDSIGNFAGDVAIKTVSGIPAVIGGITGLAGGSFSALTGGNFSDGFDDNPFMNMAESINAYGDDLFPHFQEAKFHDMSFGQKLFTALGQLATSNVETVGFLAQSFGLAGLLGKVGVGTRIVNALAKGKSYATIFSELASPNLAKLAGTIDEVTMNAFLTTNESAMEGIDSKKSVIQKLHSDRMEGKNNMTDEEIEAAGGKALGNVFWLNMLTGAATNGFFTKLTKPIFSKSSAATRANKLGMKMMDGTEGLAQSPTYASGFQRFLFDEGHAAGMTTKRFFEQGLSEGFEEDLQYSIQKVNDASNLNRSFLESSKDLAKDFLMHGLDFSDDARLESTALGSIMGAGGVPITAAAGYGAVKEARTTREAREKAEEHLNKSYTDFMSSNILSKSNDKKGKLFTKEEDGQSKFYNETDERVEEVSFQTYQRIKEAYPPNEKGEYIVPGELPVDAEGNVEIDRSKAAEFAAAAKLHSEFDNFIDSEAVQPNVDNLKISLYQLSKLKHLAQMSFENGTTDLLIQKLDSYTKLSPEKLQRAGIENPEEIQQTVDRWKKHIERLEANYLSTQNGLITTGSDTKIKNYRKTVAEVGGRIVNLDTLVEDVDKEIENVIANSPIATRLRSVQEAFQQTDDVEPLFPYVSTDETTAEETKIAELSTKRKDLVAAREELGTLYSQMMEPKKGFKKYQEAVSTGALAGFGKTSREKSRNISFSDTFTDAELTTYLDKNAQLLQHKDKVKVAKSAFFADAINMFVKYLTKVDYTVESADSLQDLTNKILKNGYTMYPDEVDKLSGIITNFVEAINTPYRDLSTAFEAEGYGERDMDFYEPETEEQEKAYEEWQRLRDIKEALKNLDTDLEGVLTRLQELKGFPEIRTDENIFKVEAAEGLLDASERILNASAWDGETISPEYDNLVGIKIELDKLSKLINKGLIPLAKKEDIYRPVLAKAKALHADLKRIEALTKINVADKELKNKLEDLHYATGVNSLAPERADLKALIALDPVLGAMATADILAQSPEEEVAAIKLRVFEEAKKTLEGLKVFELTSSPADFKLTAEDINIMLEHPTKGFGGIFSLILRKEASTVGAESKMLEALENFTKDYDIIRFSRALDNNFLAVTTAQQIKDLLFLQSQLIALEQIKQTKAAGFNNVNFLNSIREYIKKNPNAPTPSSSQIRVVRELALFALTPNNDRNQMYQNGAALKAPAGAGKSLVVSRLLKHVLKLSGDDIVTAAPKPLAAKNIKESLESPTGPFMVEELTAMLNAGTIAKNVKLLVIDEVGALLNEPINKFAAAFAKYNREHPDAGLKFVFLYDPNQVTPGSIAAASLDKNFSAEPAISETAYWEGDEATRQGYRTGERMANDHATLPFIENIQNISPLSVTYRSDVAEIVDLQNAFKTEGIVENLQSAASIDPLISTKDILGSKVEQENTIVNVFAKSQAENPERSRSIIVGSEAKRERYQKQFPNAEVLTVSEAQGITRDEVYIDVEPTDAASLNVPKVFNSWMYTAISRGSLYVQVANTANATFKEDREIPGVVDKVKASRAVRKDLAVETLTSQIETLSKITEDVVVEEVATPKGEAEEEVEEPYDPENPEDPEIVEDAPEEPEESEEEPEETPDILGNEPAKEEDLETADYGQEVVPDDNWEPMEGTHSLKHPSSEVLFSANTEEDLPALQPGDRVMVVKDITPKRDGSPATRYLVLQPIGVEEDGSVFAYRKVAILGDAELPSFISNLKASSISGLKGYTFENSESGMAGLINPTEPITSSLSLFVQPSTEDIKYVYAPTATDDFSADVDEDGKLQTLAILRKYFESLYGPDPGEHIEDYDNVLKNFDKHTKIISFQYKKDIRHWFAKAASDKQRPLLGPPYLVIHNIKNAKSGKPINNQFIRLVPAVLNKNIPDRPDFQLSKVYEFLSKVKRFEEVLATSGLGGKLPELKNGIPVVVGKERYYPFHSFIISMSKAYAAKQKGTTVNVFLTDTEHLKGVLPTVPSNKVPDELLRLAFEIDILIHGEVGSGETRAYAGEAQKAMDAIGRQNFITTLKDGTNLILSDYRKSWFKSREKKEVTNSAGMSLLGPVKWIRAKGLANNTVIKDRLHNRMKTYHERLVERGLGETARAKFVEGIIKSKGIVHMNPFTTKQLEGLFVDNVDKETGSFSGHSDGFGIRTPMGAEFDASSEGTTSGVRVAGVVETHYVKTNPTRIVVGTAPNMEPAAVPETLAPKGLTALQQLRRVIRDTKLTAKEIIKNYSEETIAEFVDFMGENTLIAAMNSYRRNAKANQATIGAKNIYQSLKDISDGDSSNLSIPALTEEMNVSLQVAGIGRDRGKVASRDFIRGAVLVRLLAATTQNEVMDVSDLARTDFYSGTRRSRTEAEFNSSLIALAELKGLSDTVLVTRFNEILDAYNKLAASYKIGPTPSTIDSVEDIYDALGGIVKMSTAMRALLKNTSDPAIPVPKKTLVDFSKKLLEKAEISEEEFTALLESPDNVEFKKQLGELTDEEDYFDAATKAVEADTLERSQTFEGMDQDLGTELSPQEVEELMNRINPPSLFQLFKSYFKKKSNSEVFRMFKFGELANRRGETVWGLYKNGVINYALNANGKIGSRTVRHEMFHKIFWEYLTGAEQALVLGLAKEKWGELPVEALEEKLAVDFETFAADKKPNVFQVFWQKLLRLLGFTFNNLSSLEKFFGSIQGGVYNKKVNFGNVERSQVNIAANFDNLDEYLYVKSTLLNSFIDIESSRGLNGKVLSFSEIIKASFARLSEIRSNPSIQFPNATAEKLAANKKALSKVLDNVKLSNAFVDTFFGQAQTKDTFKALYDERKQRQLDELLLKEAELKVAVEEDKTLSEELANVTKSIAGISAETFDTELSDPSIKLTGNVKQRLISIRYLKDGQESYAALGEAFSIILPRVASIPVESMETALYAMKQAFEGFGSKSAKLSSNIRTATGRFMLGTVNRIINRFEDATILKNVAFRKDASSKQLYAIVSIDNSPVGNKTFRDAELNPSLYKIVTQIEGGTTDTLIRDIAQAIGSDYTNVAKAYYLFEDLDFVRSLLSAVSSLRENLPFTAVEEYKYGEYTTKYMRVKTGGGKQIHESYISQKFDAYTAGIEGNTLFPASLLSEIQRAGNTGTTEEKKDALRKFTSLIGVNRPLTEVSTEQIDVMFEGFHKGLEEMQAKFKAGVGEGMTYEEYQENRRGANLIKTETRILRNIIDVVNNHYQLSETHSYTRADGQKAYGWIDASYQSQLLTAITRAIDRGNKGLSFKSFSTFSYNPKSKKLVTSDRFLSNNIFFNGINTLSGFIDHDGLKTKGNDLDAVYLTKESLKDFRKRNIVFGFFSKIGFGSTYFQFLPIPSNRTTIQAVEVKALKGTEIDKALESIILAQKNRPDPKNNPDLATTATYVKNWKQWKLAGLEGNVDSLTAKEALEQVKEHARVQAKEVAKDFQQGEFSKQPKIRIPDQDLKSAMNLFGLGRLPNIPAKTAEDDVKEAYVTKKNEAIGKIIELFYLNSMVNQYSAAQLLYGDETFYKSKEDQTKRIQMTTATGDTLLTDEIYGIPAKSKVLVVEDLKLTVPKDLEGVLGDSYRDAYEASDAEGYMLPEFYEKIARTYGIESLTDIVMKPMYFSIENGIPTAIKYSVKVLTNELCAKFPHLNTYREAMRDAGADQMVFESAVKVGLPVNSAKLNPETGDLIRDSVSDLTMLTLNNSNLRFQLNPASDVDKAVANLSQGVAFMNTNGLNFAESFDLFKLQGFLISTGLKRVSRGLRLTRKGSMSPASKVALTKKIVSSLEGLPGGRDVLEMMQAVDPETKRKASLNLPLISERVVSTIASMMTKATTGFKFKGSKLVLQADLGMQELYDERTGKKEMRKLKFRDQDGFCEVILPESYKEYMNEGDTFLPGSQNGLVGFRIPSTNYHSLLPLKVVGFYPVPKGSKGNIVIAPSLIVYYHGSDYDIDSLFVIRKEKYEKKSTDLNELLSLHLPEHKNSKHFVLEEGKTVPGFTNKGSIQIGNKNFHEYLDSAINQVSKKIETLTHQLAPAVGPKPPLARQTELRKQIEALTEHLNTFSEVAEASAKNHIVDLFSKNMLDMKNRTDLLTPISFKSVKALRSEKKEELSKLLTEDSFMYDLQAAGLIEIIC